MKRNLDKQQHQMTEWEKENLWLAIQNEADGKKKRGHGLGWVPTAGVGTVLAVLVLTVLMWPENQKELMGPTMGIPMARVVETERPKEPETLADKETKWDSETLEEAVSKQAKEESSSEIFASKQYGQSSDAAVQLYGELAVEQGLGETNVEATPEEVGADKPPRKFAVDSLNKGVSNIAGVTIQAGKTSTPSGRSGEVSIQSDGAALNTLSMQFPAVKGIQPSPGSVTGGTTPPNGETFELMYFEHTGVNPFLPTEEDSLSTFAIDVDNASWNLACNYLNNGSLPPKSAIRVEEFVNAFSSGLPEYRRPKGSDEAFAIHVDAMESPFGPGYQLMRVGIVGAAVDPEDRKPASLIFVIDTSGSMRRENRLDMVKDALKILLEQLREGDTVGIITYGSRGEIVLEPTDISRRSSIISAIESLQCNGSTNAEEGLQLAYRMAREHYQANVVNRLILCSDGVANVGSTEAGGVLDVVRRQADEGITLSTIGFGMGNYNDVFMEKLADKGDGNYFYVDTLKEAERVFKENLTGTLQTIAREVKIQVAVDPEAVERWRLLGYENRDVADEDFRNDKVDAGEIGAGHQVTALYEIKMKEEFLGSRGKIAGTVRVRQEGPAHDAKRAGKVTESALGFFDPRASIDRDPANDHLMVQALVAEFAEILRGSFWAKGNQIQNLVPIADELARKMSQDEQVQNLAKMIRKAASLSAEKPD